jgi:hypothetical protein
VSGPTATTVADPAVAVAVRWRRLLFLAMVFVLPLHTVFVRGWIAWRPFLVLLVVVVVLDVVAGVRARAWPWHRAASWALLAFLGAVAASWPGTEHAGRFSRLLLALGVGGAVMLVTERGLRTPGAGRHLLRVVFWSGAAMAATGALLAFASTGSLGAGTMGFLDDLPLVDRFSKPAYLAEGFVAVTNWHQDPGYAAAWTNLWAALGLTAAAAGLGSGRRWLDAVVLGGLGFATLMTMSRTGWMGLVLGLGVTAAVLAWKSDAGPADLAVRLGTASLVGLALFGALWATDPEGVGGDVSRQFEFRLDQGLSLGTLEGEGIPGAEDGPADIRGEVWPRYVDAFGEHPVRGIGLGTGWETPGMQEPHNLALQLLGESGLLGLAGFLALAWVVVRRGSGLVGAVALVVALLPAATQTVLFEPTWWFAAGLLLGGAVVTRSSRPIAAPTTSLSA